MSETPEKTVSESERQQKARRRFLAGGVALFGITASSSAQASWLSICFDKPCFLKGTLITAERDGAITEIAVEDLREGDRVRTRSGSLKPIKWIGVSRSSFEPSETVPNSMRPVRVQQGALGGGLPKRDLLLSQDHALFIDDCLVPVKYLINGATITLEPATGYDSIDYYHVELARHDVIEAEGAAVETYREMNNRNWFDNAATDSGKPVEPPFAPLLTMSRKEMLLADIKSLAFLGAFKPGKIETIRARLADIADSGSGRLDMAA